MPKLHELLPKVDPDYSRPMAIIESLRFAAGEVDYSNYDNRMIGYAELIIRDWCKQNKVSLGPTREALDKRRAKMDDERHAKIMAEFEAILAKAVPVINQEV